MKLNRFLSMSAMLLLLGTTALVYAQEPRPDAKPEEPRPEAAKPQQQQQEEPKPSKPEQGAKPPHNEEKPSAQKGKPGHDEHAAQHDARATAGAHRGGRIPDDKFRAHFGREHKVVINHPTIVEGRPRFQYSGYWFTIVDPWPVEWAYTDDCYIDYVDGEYFLYDLLHPGVRIAIFVEM